MFEQYLSRSQVDRAICSGLVVVALFSSLSAEASERGAFSMLHENDALTGSDNNYSSGVGVLWASGEVGRYAQETSVARWFDFWSF